MNADVAVTVGTLLAAVTVLILGFLFELAGETVPGWHTISWWAHRDRGVRWAILVGIALFAVILIIGLDTHFNGNSIGR